METLRMDILINAAHECAAAAHGPKTLLQPFTFRTPLLGQGLTACYSAGRLLSME